MRKLSHGEADQIQGWFNSAQKRSLGKRLTCCEYCLEPKTNVLIGFLRFFFYLAQGREYRCTECAEKIEALAFYNTYDRPYRSDTIKRELGI